MLFTRTIRRKMMIGLALVMGMLLALSLGGVSGLASYRQLVKDFEYRLFEVPKQSELNKSFAALTESLLQHNSSGDRDPDSRKEASKLTPAQMEYQRGLLKDTRAKVHEYHIKLESVPHASAVNSGRLLASNLLADINWRLDRVEKLQEFLDDETRSTRAQAIVAMQLEIAQMHRMATSLPDHQRGLHDTLNQAQAVYNSRFRLIGWTTAIVGLLFFGLWRYMYSGIFAPLKKLHQGASRVAQGDFHYRLELGTHDEMAELAESFNKMTARFQEIAQDLDRQVRERSKQLVRSERLAGIGFLAAGVAHEINNPLSAISMAAESLQGRYPEPQNEADREDAEVAVQYLEMIQRESYRCQNITARLLHFARGDGADRERCDLTTIVSEVLSMIQHMSKYQDRNIVFDRSAACYAEVNGPEIKQVVLNIAANALDSMNDGGTLRIDLAEQTDDVVICFEDDGCGMTPEVIENLFEPFFTSRKGGKGTGLGMSISQRIVGDHGGTIEATSNGPGCGSKFRVHLPRRAASREVAA